MSAQFLRETRYMRATHKELIGYTRWLLSLSMGELTKLHKDIAGQNGAEHPAAVWARAVLMTRMASGMVKPTKEKA